MKHFNKIEPQVVPHFYKGEWIGDLNEFENLDLRTRILENNLEGYSVFFNEEHMEINKDGEFGIWPKGLYTQSLELFAKKIKIKKANAKNS